MDVEVARVLALGVAGRDRTQRRAEEESHFDVIRDEQSASATPCFASRGCQFPEFAMAHQEGIVMAFSDLFLGFTVLFVGVAMGAITMKRPSTLAVPSGKQDGESSKHKPMPRKLRDKF